MHRAFGVRGAFFALVILYQKRTSVGEEYYLSRPDNPFSKQNQPLYATNGVPSFCLDIDLPPPSPFAFYHCCRKAME